MQTELSKYKVIERYPVHWGDMDSANHVNNLIYLRWAESGRIAYFQKIKMDTSFGGDETGPILGWQDCKYIFPVTFPDTVVVGVRVAEILDDRFMMECAVFSEKHQRIAALSKQSIIPYNYAKLKKVPLPEAWVAAIQKIESGTSVI
ncbi:MAG: thioesterase [Bacteroidetes bacterium]|nr:MAG: thioesterase [Bacteroidota bacterium]